MEKAYKRRLEGNLFINVIIRIFTKRIYLAVIAIYAVADAGLSLEQIGIIAGITAAAVLIMEIPSGYISDKFGHKKTLVLGSFLVFLSPLCYLLWPNFFGVLMASLLFFLGGTFHSGTLQAFIHETLLELDRDADYSKVMGRAQSWSLVANAVLVVLVTLTYSIDQRLPFLIGAFSHALTVLATLFFVTPKRTEKNVKELVDFGILSLAKTIYNRGEILLFIFLGVVTALSTHAIIYREIYFQEIGIPMWFFGVALSIASILGAILSYHIHRFDSIERNRLFILDAVIVVGIVIAVGLVAHPVLVIIAFTLLPVYGRSRNVLIHSALLSDCPTRKLKATYLSVLAFFESLNGLWVPVLLGYAVGIVGVRQGYLIFGLIILCVLFLLYALMIYQNKTRSRQRLL